MDAASLSGSVEQAWATVRAAFQLDETNSGAFWGEWAPGTGRETLESASPIDGRPLAQVATAGAEDYDKVLSQARRAAVEWAELPAPRRGEIIKSVVDELARYKDELGLLVSLEVGKTLSEGRGEIQEMIDIGYFALGLSRQLYGVTTVSERRWHRLQERWHPLGPIAVITSFNFPAAVWSWNALIAAVVGDVVVWKPSSEAPLTAIAVTRVVDAALRKAGAPSIFFLLVGSGRTVGDRLLEDGHLPLVSFTGSVATGRRVAQAVGMRLGRTILELGGNNAAIVTGSADRKVALRGVAFGALATAAQRCTSTRRLILHESIYPEFLVSLVDAYNGVPIGNPLLPQTLVGPLVNREAVNDMLAALEQAKEQGGRLVCGGGETHVPQCPGGHYVLPTIMEANPSMPAVQEETFAPLLYVFKYRSLAQAIEIHNSVPQGLSSAIFSTDLREVEEFLSHTGSDCGLANVNTSTAGAEIGGAFGGEKHTGGGRESGSDAWKAYARRQTSAINYGADLPLAQGVEFEFEASPM
jgi:aldehyde dehydrogenase (NAD+)